MSAHYDNFDYPAYWKDRTYEHECEVLALKKFMAKIPKINRILEIGAGFGRLTPYYLHRSKNIVLTDPSRRLLSLAEKKLQLKRKYKGPKITTVQTGIETLPKKFRSKSFDFILMVRVMHHLADPNEAFRIMSRLLSDNGYLIVEFPNKLHWKAIFENFRKGNLTFPLEIYPTDKRSKSNRQKRTIPFLNFHPDIIMDSLKKNHLQVIEVLSVSNIRSTFIKKNLPLDFMLSLEDKMQKPLAKLRFGPSIFVLAKKKSR